jgi:hypothetical protein
METANTANKNILETGKKSALNQIGAGNKVKQVKYTLVAEDDPAEDDKQDDFWRT